MNREYGTNNIYQSLPMQAALRLYMPHSDSLSETHIPETISVEVPMEPLHLRFGRLIKFLRTRRK